MSQKYCNSLVNYSRFKTREVLIGDVGIGGGNPVRIQSMTTTDTMNTQETVDECIRLIQAGCELIRITAPSIKESKNLKNIKESLLQKGYSVPLIADIHYTPNAAEIAARIVEKVRINPGNYVDKKRFKIVEYSNEDYLNELKKIESRFLPLVNICKQNNTAMRIGTNHGSLSDRILSRYGDTPFGMVESAMEFVRICSRKCFRGIDRKLAEKHIKHFGLIPSSYLLLSLSLFCFLFLYVRVTSCHSTPPQKTNWPDV